MPEERVWHTEIISLCHTLYERTVCFFVLCKRHWINRVPGAHRRDSLCIPFTLTLTLAMPSYL